MSSFILIFVIATLTGASLLMFVLHKLRVYKNHIESTLNDRMALDKSILRRIDDQSVQIVQIKKALNTHNFQSKNTSQSLYRNIESLLKINEILSEKIYGLGGWALSADALLYILEFVKNNKPKVIVELGSGKSTYAIGLLIKNLGLNSKIITIDHEKEYLDATMKTIKQARLLRYVDPVLAPLKKSKGQYSKKTPKWYDSSEINKALNGKSIDLVIVDGPPGTSKMARYPAVPELKNYLSKDYAIFIDDFNRNDENEIVRLWSKILSNSTIKTFESEKGLAVLCPTSTDKFDHE